MPQVPPPYTRWPRGLFGRATRPGGLGPRAWSAGAGMDSGLMYVPRRVPSIHVFSYVAACVYGAVGAVVQARRAVTGAQSVRPYARARVCNGGPRGEG